MPAPWSADATGLRLSVRLTPKASREGFDGVETRDDGQSFLKFRVRTPPEDGKANAALLTLVASTLDVPRSAVSLAAGGKSRAKTVRVEGPPEALAARLTALLQSTSP